MNSMRSIAIIAAMSFVNLCIKADGQELPSMPEATDKLIQKPLPIKQASLPVSISAQTTPGEQIKLEIHLTIEKGGLIYSEQKTNVGLELKTEVLDEQQKPIPCEIEYPKKVKPSPFLKGLEQHSFYSAKPKLIATTKSKRKPAFVTVRYSGFNEEMGY